MNHIEQQKKPLSRLACPNCDLIQSLPEMKLGEVARCVRCKTTLYKNLKNSVNRSLAFAITGLILFVLANLFPLLSLKAMGLTQEGTLFATSLALFQADRPFLSLIILMTTIVFPLTTLLGTIYILLQVKVNHINTHTAPLFRFLLSIDSWGMLEIFMLAMLVSIVKLGDVADVIFGISLYAFCLLIVALSLLSHSLNPDDVWNKMRIMKGCHV